MRILSSYYKKCIILIISTFIVSFAAGQTTPVIGLHQNIPNVVMFTNAKIMVKPGKIIENGQLLIRNGQIESIGKNIVKPEDAIVKDLKLL